VEVTDDGLTAMITPTQGHHPNRMMAFFDGR